MSRFRGGRSWWLGVVAALLAAPSAVADTADRQAVYALAGKCFALQDDAPLSFKATGLGTFLLLDRTGQLIGVRDGGRIGPVGGPEAAGPAAEWALHRVARRTFTLRSTSARRAVAIGSDGRLRLGSRAAPVKLTRARGCRAFPEAGLGASGRPGRSLNADGTLRGFADTHLHITADMRAGGRVIGGEPFDRFGIVRALGRDAADHGDDGSLDYTGNLLRDGLPVGTHDTAGWPAFTGWPTNDTNTHEQVYYRWLQRAWLAGLRLTVAETVEDTQLCKVEPRRRYSCDETTAIAGQVRRLRDMQDYVDAQSGGPGRGWLRIVTTPAAARRVIARGKLAVVLGMESSFPLDCRAERGRRCTPAQVDRRLDRLHRLGIRSMFIAHWADNGFAGAAIEDGLKGKFINALGRLETGRWFRVGGCPHPGQGEQAQSVSEFEASFLTRYFPAAAPLVAAAKPTYPEGLRCNARGLTRLGRHLVRRMMAKGMLIELDHLSERAREQVLTMAERARYPVVSGHSDTGGRWTRGELRRLTAVGGIASQRLGAPEDLARAIVARRAYRSPGRFFGVGLGTDTGGFSTLPAAPADGAARLTYPFSLHGGGVSFRRQRTGARTFDFTTDGVAHYGLLPDLLADMERRPGGQEAMRLLFRSAEAYVRMWELAGRRR